MTGTNNSHNEYYVYYMYIKTIDAFVTCSSFYLFFESLENKFIDENSVLDKKKLLSLKCVISDTLIGSQRDKLPTLIGVCI